ncbi:MAG: NAD(P)/FAD-dependent oxidoreductase [Verrucomicrobiota bacterium]
MKTYDYVILGGGSAGYAAARTAVGLGMETAVIEGGEPMGGLCILRGCMPSKTLIESANRALSIRHARDFGLRAEDYQVHPKEVRDRKRALIADFAGYRQEQLQSGKFDLVRGRGTFLDEHRLRVAPLDGSPAWVMGARAVLIATGSRPRLLEIPGLEEVGYWLSDDVLDAEVYPERIAILGGGAIALEMAHFFDGIGKEVSLIQRSPRFLREFDPEISEALLESFRERGMQVFSGTTLQGFEKTEGGKKVIFEQAAERKEIEVDEILLSVGRLPESRGLQMEAAGLAMNSHWVQTGPDQRTGRAHVFAAGDVCGPLEVVHLAIEQAERATRNAARQLGKLGGEAEEMSYRLKLFGIFTSPEMALVGRSEEEARDEGIPVVAARYPFDDHGKSLVMGETSGMVKLIAHRETGEILGGQVVGPHGVELIHEIVVAMRFRATAQQLATTPHYHPTLAEIWTYPAEELAEATQG